MCKNALFGVFLVDNGPRKILSFRRKQFSAKKEKILSKISHSLWYLRAGAAVEPLDSTALLTLEQFQVNF